MCDNCFVSKADIFKNKNFSNLNKYKNNHNTLLRFLSRLFTFKSRSNKIVCFFRMWIALIISICLLSFTSSTSFIWDMSIWWLLSIRCFATLDLSWFPLLIVHMLIESDFNVSYGFSTINCITITLARYCINSAFLQHRRIIFVAT